MCNIEKVGQQVNCNATEKESATAIGIASVGSETADVTIDTAVTYVAQIRELEQCNVVVKARVRVDVGAQLSSPRASPIKLRVDPK
ncbi:hypothetical protein RDI58_004234 [Solanum bulbocastanum]|uniref:Uncharacterized protein n=1 Tax=Solanum bulbocastanum TaxID=147425 RepID=A0AAN8TXF0_SOLBU